ncbi:MAG: FAD:protein FMN transferase [Ardenticatenaceae bacterium]
MQRIEFRAMGCQMLAVLDNDSLEAAEQLAQLPDWFEIWEQSLSRFRPDSELSRLNRQAGEPVAVSEVMWQVAQEAIDAAHYSQGLVVPTLLDALEAAGYDRSFDEMGTFCPKQASPMANNSWQQIKFDFKCRTITLPTGSGLDLGGIAKGWAAHQAAHYLSRWGGTLVDAGGDIAISGPMSNQQAWPIGICDPFGRQPEPLLLLDEGGIATSGRDYRRWQQDGKWQHHIIDPRTGEPAQTDLLSATVVAPTVEEAEVAAKMVLILGSQKGLEWLEAEPLLAGVMVCEDSQIIYSRGMERYLCPQS